MRENKIRLFVSSILLSIALVVGGCTAKDAGQQAQPSASQSNLSGEKNDEKTVGVTEGSSNHLIYLLFQLIPGSHMLQLIIMSHFSMILI